MTTAYDLIFVTGYFTDTCLRWNKKLTVEKNRAEFKIYFAKEHRAWKYTHPTSAGAVYSRANALVESNTRELETMDTIALLSANTSSDRDTYVNLS